MEPQEQNQGQNVRGGSRKKKIMIIATIIFILFFVAGYVSGTLVSYEEKWFGAGPTFLDALKPF